MRVTLLKLEEGYLYPSTNSARWGIFHAARYYRTMHGSTGLSFFTLGHHISSGQGGSTGLDR